MDHLDGIHTHALLDRDARRTIARRLQLRLALAAPIMAIALGATVVFRGAETNSASLGAAAIMGVVVLVAFALVYRRTLAHELVVWRSFRLAIEPQLVRRVAAGVAPLEITRAQVAKMIALPGRGLMLIGHDGKSLLFVPEQLDGYPEVRAELASWAAVVETKSSPTTTRGQVVGIMIAITLVASWLGTGLDDLRLATLAGVSLLLHVGVCAWLTLRDPNQTARRKVLALGVWSFMAAGGWVQLAFRFLVSP